MSLFSFLWVLFIFIRKLVKPEFANAGWASIICVICFIGGLQLLALGIIGEYIGKIYLETKERPRYIISDRIGNY